VSEARKKIEGKRIELKEATEKLGALYKEMAELKVQSQMAVYQMDFEGALRDQREVQQYEKRVHKLKGDIKASEKKAQWLSEELEKLQKLWD